MSISVLSLFDGMSCGQIALNRLGIKYNKYYASEIDKYAIKVAMANYPNTIQLGDVTQIDGTKLNIDLLMGGSPCQGFSIAGKRLNFNDPRSKLFFEYVRLLKETKPKWFLLENVKMKKECQDLISQELGVSPILINSARVSAQNRERLYWTNLPVTQPIDKKIYLKDIIENGVVDRDKSYCIDACYYKGGNLTQYFDKKRRQLVFDKSRQSSRRLMVYDSPKKLADIDNGGQGNRVYDINGKNVALSATSGGKGAKTGLILDKTHIRKLTPLECERLQTVPEGYTNHVSNTQRYKMLGNGWTVDVICHILKGIKNDS